MKKHTPVLLLLFFALLGCTKETVDIRDNFTGVYQTQFKGTVMRSKRENNFYMLNYGVLVTASKSDELSENQMYLTYSNEKHLITLTGNDFTFALKKTTYPIISGSNNQNIDNFNFTLSGSGYFTTDGKIYIQNRYNYDVPSEKDNFFVDISANGNK